MEPEAEIHRVHLYDYTYTGCKSCFACQMKKNRDDLYCRVKDGISEELFFTAHADGVAFGSPVYFGDQTAMLKAFLERLLYPGNLPRKVPTAFLYAMNADEKQMAEWGQAPVLAMAEQYVAWTFGQKPEIIYAYNTFQYNDSPALTEEFKVLNEQKRARRATQFPKDLQAAFDTGAKMAKQIREGMA